MLSRFGKIANYAAKPSVLYRVVSTSAKDNSTAPVAGSEVRRYPHDAPERDFVNFPPLRIPEKAGKVRIGLIPDNWFNAMYDKTGVIGPYVIFWGGFATLFSKEIYVQWADSSEHFVFLLLIIGASKLYGKQLGEYLDKEADAHNQQTVAGLENAAKEIDVKIEENQALQSLPEANQLLNAAKKENVSLQLEASYRQRLAQVYQEVKKRLDYQVAYQGIYKRLERDQAINYIIGQVSKSIGANQEKEAFQSGLNQLKSLSQKHAGTI